MARTPEPAQLARAHSLTTTRDTDRPFVFGLCQWTCEGNSETCGAQITCGSVPVHFRKTSGTRRQIPRLTAGGRDVVDGLNANMSFGTFVSVIEAILEKGSTPTETKVGQNYAVKTVADN